MGSENAEVTDPRQAWSEFCSRLEALGQRTIADDFPADPTTQAEGFRHLTRMLRLSLDLHLEHGDPAYPHFINHEHPTQQWGGPNPDNFYLRSAIDPTDTYRISADVTGVEQIIFSTMEGDMHLQQFGVFHEVSLEQLAVDANGRLDIVLSPDEHPGNWIPLHPDARNVTIRIYQSDWARDPAPFFTIERVDAPAMARPTPTPAEVVHGLGQTMNWIEHAVPFWNQYLKTIAETRAPNALSEPHTPPGGASDISYGGGMWDLDDDHVLLIECDTPDADYWNFTIHTMPWFESGDFGRHQTSLNHRQTHIDADGKFRIVVGHADPGVPNWITTEGRAQAMITYRWVWARTKPIPESRVVAVADLAKHLPADHPTVSAAQRIDQLTARAAQVARRFR